MEVYCQLLLSMDLNYITIEQMEDISKKIERVEKMLSGLRYKMINGL